MTNSFYHAGSGKKGLCKRKMEDPGNKFISGMPTTAHQKTTLPRPLTQNYFCLGAGQSFGDLDAIGEVIFQFFDVSDDEDFLKSGRTVLIASIRR